jgi:hypothetical protein
VAESEWVERGSGAAECGLVKTCFVTSWLWGSLRIFFSCGTMSAEEHLGYLQFLLRIIVKQ